MEAEVAEAARPELEKGDVPERNLAYFHTKCAGPY